MQELNAAGDAFQILAGDAHLHTAPCARCENDRVMLLPERIQRDIFAECDIIFHRNTELFDLCDFTRKQILR